MEKFVQQFSTEAVKSGATVSGPYDLAGLMEYLRKLIASKKPAKIAACRPADRPDWLSPELIKNLATALPDQTISLITDPQTAETDFDIGITGCNFGIAQTGTIGLESSNSWARKVSALPLIHIAILNQSKILETWSEALELVNRTPSNYYALITGPSRTADIERVLTLGVHGPEELHIILTNE